MEDLLEKYIRDIPDFPKQGVAFKDITPLLKNPHATKLCVDLLYDLIKGKRVDKVVGIESRGFFFGMLLAQKLNVGFVPVRKLGKLPHEVISRSYNLEYGEDTLEMHLDAIKKDDNVLIHDDVLATGGTAKAVCKLVEKLEGNIIQCNFLMQIQFLKGKEKLNPYEVKSVLNY